MKKKPTLIIITISLCFFLAYYTLESHVIVDADNQWVYYLSIINVILWLVNFFWVLNILVFQVSSLFYKRKKYKFHEPNQIPISIIYTTCDDFDEACCLSCLDQDHKNFQVIIADDSTTPIFKSQIDTFISTNQKKYPGKLDLSRRPEKNKTGYKAGNLNYAIEFSVEDDWICLIDSDQFIPKDYLSEISSYIDLENKKLGYIQGVNASTTNSKENIPIIESFNYFQRTMSSETELYYYRDLAPRERHGFLPMLGHGAVINKKAWEVSGKFPEIVAEDFGFSMQLINNGFTGKFAETAKSFESYPIDFACFVIRIKKFARGAGELLRKKIIPFLKMNGGRVNGVDFLMMYLWYPLSLFFVLNIFLSAYLTNFYYAGEYFYMSEFIVHVITLFFVSTLAILISVSKSVISCIRLFFWLFTTYTAVMPLVAWNFWQSIFKSPRFVVTPKHGRIHRIPNLEIILMLSLGVLTCILSFFWISPFSPFILAHGISYFLFPFYNHFHKEGFIFKLSRKLIYVPGLLSIFAIILLWNFDYEYFKSLFSYLGLN